MCILTQPIYFRANNSAFLFLVCLISTVKKILRNLNKNMNDLTMRFLQQLYRFPGKKNGSLIYSAEDRLS